MKTDRELLELAAKAAGIIPPSAGDVDGLGLNYVDDLGLWCKHKCGWDWWNPLTDDGDALRLAVSLQLHVMAQEKCVYVQSNPDSLLAWPAISELEMNGNDPYTAIRRAIVRAAAQIGETK